MSNKLQSGCSLGPEQTLSIKAKREFKAQMSQKDVVMIVFFTCLCLLSQIEQLQSQMVSLESEIMRLREDNRVLQEANRAMAVERGDLQARVQLLHQHKEAEEAQAREEQDRLLAQLQSSEREAKEAIKSAVQARHRLLKLRQELGVLRAERDFHRSAANLKAKPATLANNKIRSKTPWADASSRTRMQNRMDSPAKDDWEDMSADRYFPHLSLSLSLSRFPSLKLSLFF